MPARSIDKIAQKLLEYFGYRLTFFAFAHRSKKTFQTGSYTYISKITDKKLNPPRDDNVSDVMPIPSIIGDFSLQFPFFLFIFFIHPLGYRSLFMIPDRILFIYNKITHLGAFSKY